jgi:FtsP/CotA-like multicopper oxidase with cupredoxin domain
MSTVRRSLRASSRRFGDAILLALVLSAGLAASTQLTSAILNPLARGSTTGPPGLLITVPLALLAAWAGITIASMMGLDGRGWAAALNKAALVSLSFTALTAGFGIGAALMSAATGFPMVFVAAFLLGHWRDRHAEDPLLMVRDAGDKARLPQFVYIASAVSLIGFAVTATGMASAGATTTTAAPVTATTNPCTSAPHDTFNISAINVDITLNKYGVHDPNSFMYVLNSNISAVRAEEASGKVSTGLGDDAIQPLVIRAHEGDCVTVNLTNATTFGVQAMDQPPEPDPADGCNNGTSPPLNAAGQCDGTLTRTAPENIAWNADGLPGLSANDVSTDVGQNADTTTAPGKTSSYTVYMDPALGEGAHVFHSTGDDHEPQAHGLFGAIISEPAGSQWLDPNNNNAPLASGWDATIEMPQGPSFREFALLFHEIGDEGYRQIYEKAGATCDTAEHEVESGPGVSPAGCELPVVDNFTDAYRPCSKAINYRSECFFERELTQKNAGFIPDEAEDYGSYTNGDMATPQPDLYVGDPYKIRLINAGSEMGHVFHEHGGGIRWVRNPGATNPDIAGGLEKFPPVTKDSIRLDSQTIEPGESYDLETECGAGGCQQAAGDFLYHCHIAAHYDSGMVGFIRVFDTSQPNLATVPGRAAKPAAVTSAGLIGKVVEGKTVVPQAQLTNPSTQVALESLVEGQLPPQGVRLDSQDATVWNWAKSGTANAPLYLGEPEASTAWADYTPPNPGQRDPIMFDPSNGRYAWPLLQPHLGMRPPFSPNGHSGAPWLGNTTSSTRPDGLCPATAPVLTYNITAISTAITDQTDSGRTSSGSPIDPQTDQNGEIFVLNEDVAAVQSGAKQAVPLALRSDVGDCVAVTLTNDLNPSTAIEPASEENVYRKANIHIHFVQFDPQASDGVITGLSFEQAVRPITGGELGETTLTAAAPAGATQLTVASTAGLRPGVSVEVGQGKPDTEVVTKITAINGTTLTLNAPLKNAHASGEPTGVEFVQYRWYSDVDDGTVFFHDHVDALSSWGHGLFGAHIIEPAGSTFHDPVTGAPIRSGPIADIYTTGSAGFGEKGDFREFVLWQQEGITSSGSPQGCQMASFNLRAAPLIARDPNAANPNNANGPDVSVPDGVGNYNMGFTAEEEPAGSDRVNCTNVGTSNDPYVFSSVAHGDPPTPILRAYVGDPVVIRQVGLDEQVGDLRITGHRFAEERFSPEGVLTDAGTAGVSEKMDYVIEGGAGGDRHLPGDYLYYAGKSQDLESGAWGIFRVMNTLHSSGSNALEALPDRTAPPTGAGFPTLTTTGKAPPAAPNGPGTGACPNSAPVRSYDVSIFNGVTFDKGMPGESDNDAPGSSGSWATMYSLSSDESAIKAGTKPVVPLVIRANAGDCLRVTLHNDLPVDNWTWTWGSGSTRAGFNIGNVIYDPLQSYGAAIGYDPDTTVAPGSSRLYSYYVDKELGTNLILNMGNESSWRGGAYGALIAEPAGSTYTDPFTGQPLQSGIFADITPGSGAPFRENVTIFSDREPLLGHDIMIYYLDSDHSYTDYNEQSLTQEEGDSLTQINLWQAKSDAAIGVGNGSATPEDPSTPVFEAFAGDPVRWRFADAAGDNPVSFQIAGAAFPLDHGLPGSQIIEARAVLPGETFDAYLVNGAGGATGATGDYEYNVGRDPIIKSGDWGIFRVLPTSAALTTGHGLRKL